MRPEKAAIAEELKQQLGDSSYVILADYTGMTVFQAQELRGQLGEHDSRMVVLRNRQFTHVVRELGIEGLDEKLTGPTAMFYGAGDVVQTSKILKAFSKANQLPVVKVGSLDGKPLSPADVAALADLPSLDVQRAILVGTLAAPMTQLVGVMNQKVSTIVYVLGAYQEKKTGEG